MGYVNVTYVTHISIDIPPHGAYYKNMNIITCDVCNSDVDEDDVTYFYFEQVYQCDACADDQINYWRKICTMS